MMAAKILAPSTPRQFAARLRLAMIPMSLMAPATAIMPAKKNILS
jgi:hypothetical protein